MEQKQRCVIIGAAEIQNYEKIKTHFRNGDYYIYCDAGLKHQEKLGVWPDLIIGDFDSYSKAEMERKYQRVGDTSMPADANTAACGDAPELIVLPCEKDDTDTVFASARPESADKTITRGTDKSVPYKVRSKTQQRTNAARGNHGFRQCFEPGYQRYMYP